MSRSAEQKHHNDKYFPSKKIEQQFQAWWENKMETLKGQQWIIDQKY